MHDGIDREYRQARVAAERKAILNATSDVARNIHEQLAHLHLELAGIKATSAARAMPQSNENWV